MSKESVQHVATEYALNNPAMMNSGLEIRTFLFCRHALIGAGLEHLLEGSCFVLSGVASNVESLSRYCAENALGLLIIDRNASPGQMIETIRHLKLQCPQVRLVAIADDFELDFVQLGHEAGVDGFCRSASCRDVLIKSLELVMAGEAVLPTSIVSSLLKDMSASLASTPQERRDVAALDRSDPKAQKLSIREAEILSCLMQGAPNKVIARHFEVAEATVKVHVKAILRKIGAANRTQAAIWATENLPRTNAVTLNT